MAYTFSRIEPYGFIIILALLFTKVLDIVMWPLVTLTIQLVAGLFDVPVLDLYKLLKLLSK